MCFSGRLLPFAVAFLSNFRRQTVKSKGTPRKYLVKLGRRKVGLGGGRGHGVVGVPLVGGADKRLGAFQGRPLPRRTYPLRTA